MAIECGGEWLVLAQALPANIELFHSVASSVTVDSIRKRGFEQVNIVGRRSPDPWRSCLRRFSWLFLYLPLISG